MKPFLRTRGYALLALAIALIGCASTRVKKNPGPHDRGLRYYLPKPYLLVDRAAKQKASGPEGKVVEVTPIPNMVKLTLEYLPDFSEEYSIHARAGIGKNTTKVALVDGWRLDKIDVDVDSQATEFVTALAGLLGTEPKLFGGATGAGLKGGGAPESAETRSDLPAVTVEAHDVPLGYYESVIAPGPDGRKRMYGWRYVGFAPYATCPIDASGSTAVCCPQSELYGLVSVGKTMYFRKLNDLANNNVVLVRSPVPPPVEKKEKPPAQQQKPKEPEKPAPAPAATATGYLVTPIPVDQMPKPKSDSPPPPRDK